MISEKDSGNISDQDVQPRHCQCKNIFYWRHDEYIQRRWPLPHSKNK
jgi:hypothetical protein